MKTNQRALLIANGDAQTNLSDLITSHDYLIAVDGGLKHLMNLGKLPHLLIGDLDSISQVAVQACELNNVEILRFPREKNESDLELALLEASSRGYSQLTVSNTGGGRVDHLLGNLSVLFHPAFKNLQLKLQDQNSQIYPLTSTICLQTQPADLISIIPWGQELVGVSTTGLAYPLDNETLYPYQTRGLSNQALGETITVSIREGQALLVHTPQSPHRKEKPCPEN